LIRASGGVGIGTNNPQGALEVNSTTGAFIVPRMTTAQRDALTPVNGMIIYERPKVVPEVVAYEENGVDAKSPDYARLTALLVEAIKEQQKEIEKLKEQLQAIAKR